MKVIPLFALILAFASTGCARLTVQVDIYNRLGQSPDSAAEGQAATLAMQHQAAIAKGSYAYRQKLLNDGLQQLDDQLHVAGMMDTNSLSKIKATSDLFVGNMVQRLIFERDAASRLVAQAESYSGTARTRKYRDALDKFNDADRNWQDSWEIIDAGIKTNIRKGGRGVTVTPEDVLRSNPAINKAYGEVARLSRPRLDLLTSGLALFNDQFASRVVTAPEKFWLGQYNRAYGTGVVGNTNLAIQMEGPAMFTVKGLKQDSSKLTKASLQVLKQGVQMVGAAYGMPVGAVIGGVTTPAAPAATRALPVSTGDPMAAVKPLTRQETAKLLGDILSQRQALDGSPTVRDEALSTIWQRVKSLTTSAP